MNCQCYISDRCVVKTKCGQKMELPFLHLDHEELAELFASTKRKLAMSQQDVAKKVCFPLCQCLHHRHIILPMVYIVMKVHVYVNWGRMSVEVG